MDITIYVNQLTEELNEKAYKSSDALGRIGSEDVVNAMIELLKHQYPETKILAARTLSLIKNNDRALMPLLEAIKNKDNSSITGDLLVALEDFDLSEAYIELFRLYLFGSYKVSMVAKDLLDHKDFNITQRVLKKAQKHWKHYSNNIKQDEIYALRKNEVEEMLNDLRAYLN